MDREVSSHTNLVAYNHHESGVRDVVNDLPARFNFTSVKCEEVVRVNHMTHVYEDESCYGDHRERWRVKDTNEEDRHHLCVEVAEHETILLMTPPRR